MSEKTVVSFLDRFKTKSRPQVTAKKRRPKFEPEWVKLPTRWIKALRQAKRISTIHLAHIILSEDLKRKYIGGEVVLSMDVTGMNRSTRHQAMREMVELKMIEIKREGHQAIRVVRLIF